MACETNHYPERYHELRRAVESVEYLLAALETRLPGHLFQQVREAIAQQDPRLEDSVLQSIENTTPRAQHKVSKDDTWSMTTNHI
jgi:hypothetical protein